MLKLIFRRWLSGSKWRRYAQQLKERPASHLSAFAILHEISAVLPFPLISFPLKWWKIGESLPIAVQYLQGENFLLFSMRIFLNFLSSVFLEGNEKINRLRTRYGFHPLDNCSLILINLSMIVRILLPFRIGLSLFLTPFVASIITRSLSIFHRFRRKFFS